MRVKRIGWLSARTFGAVVLLVGHGCSRDVRLSGREVPTVSVGSVSHFGMSLDEQATPQQVVFAALRAIRDDFHAKDRAARERAMAIQFDLCAANELAARNRTSASRDEFIFRVVNRWTPTVSHYVDRFETDWAKAEPRLVRRDQPPSEGESGAKACRVLMEVDDPSGDPTARVVLTAWLVRDSGFWRVMHFGFDAGRRSIDGKIPPPLVQSVAASRSDNAAKP